jgi:serine/threonine protein kinase
MKKVGNYLLLSELGRGQFGVVYKCLHVYRKELYALKQIEKAQLNTPKLRELIESEVRILSGIDHPNILHLHELLETSSSFYLVLDYCPGGDLFTYVHRNKGLGEDEAVYFLMQIVCAFSELHTHKIMHRDFKLANIFLDEDKLVLGDFGFAKAGAVMTTTYLGTPVTMAPEILLYPGENKAYTNKADIWSVGVCFFEMIFGHDPWPNVKTLDELRKSVRERSGQNLVFPTDSRFKISPECKDLITRLIQIEPRNRIHWTDLLSHDLFRLHMSKRNGSDPNKSIIFRHEADNVKQMFIACMKKPGVEIHLESEPQGIDFPPLPTVSMLKDLQLKLNRDILVFFSHHKKIIVFLLQTSVKSRNLSKEQDLALELRQSLSRTAILLVRSAQYMNQQLIDILKSGNNVWNLPGWNVFISSNAEKRILNELENQDDPAYKRLYKHLAKKAIVEFSAEPSKIKSTLTAVQSSAPDAQSLINKEMAVQFADIYSSLKEQSSSLPPALRSVLEHVAAMVHICMNSDDFLSPLDEEGVHFDWLAFYQSWEPKKLSHTVQTVLKNYKSK